MLRAEESPLSRIKTQERFLGSLRMTGLGDSCENHKGTTHRRRERFTHPLLQKPAPQISIRRELGLDLHVQAAVPQVGNLVRRELERATDRALFRFGDR